MIQSQELARNWSSSLHGRRESEEWGQVVLEARRRAPAKKQQSSQRSSFEFSLKLVPMHCFFVCNCQWYYLRRTKDCGDAIEHLLKDPAADAQYGSHPKQFLLRLTLVSNLCVTPINTYPSTFPKCSPRRWHRTQHLLLGETWQKHLQSPLPSGPEQCWVIRNNFV